MYSLFAMKRYIQILCLIFYATSNALGQTILTLDQALEIAMEKSPDIRQARLNLERSQQNLNAEKARLKSHFNLSLTPFNFTRGQMLDEQFSKWIKKENKLSSARFSIAQPIQLTDGTLELINQFSWQDLTTERDNLPRRIKTFNNDLYLSFTQPIFTYNRTKLALKTLELELEHSALFYAIQKLTIERMVNQQFFDVFYRERSLDIAKEEFKNNHESYQIIKNKVEAGISAKEELYQAELNLANSRSSLENTQVGLENAFDEFKIMLGLPLDQEITVTADVSFYKIEVALNQATENALKHRMELRQREIDIQNGMADLVETSALNEFKGNVRLSYGFEGTNEEFPNIYEDPERSQEVSISFEIPLWDWGEKKARIKAAEAALDRQHLNKKTEMNDILIGLREAFRSLKNQLTQIDIAKTNVKNAELTYEINLERYKNGDLTSKDLGYYQNQLSREKLGYIQALINYRLALLDIKIQSLWDFEKNQSVVPEI